MNTLRVMLCDDHAVVRAGLRYILEQAPAITVVGEAGSGDELLDLAGSLAPDVVILDLSMPGRQGLDVIEALREVSPGSKLLILTVHAEEDYVMRALERGARGYLLKGAPAETLLAALQLLAAGGIPIDESLHAALGRRARGNPGVREGPALSARESQLLRYIAAGYTNREIADALGLSLRTIERQRGMLGNKLGLRGRAALVNYALRSKLQFEP